MADYKLMMLEWVDASRLSDGWMDLDAIPDPYPHLCVTVGFLVAENEYAKTLVPTIGDTGHPENSHTYGGMMIPRGAIVSEKVLTASSSAPRPDEPQPTCQPSSAHRTNDLASSACCRPSTPVSSAV